MPSPGEAVTGVAAVGARRARVERVLRAALVVLLAVALWRAWRASGDGAARTHLSFGRTPSALTRDSLAAHLRAGDPITWDGALTPLAAMAEPVREPGGRWRVSVAARGDVALHDSLGAVDSLRGEERTVTMSAARGPILATSGVTTASALPHAEVTLGRIALLARAGWEAKFVVAALEEAGWGVDTRLTLGRGVEVVQGDPRPRLARHAAVVVLDTLPGPDADALARYVREGGGLVLAGIGARLRAPALAPVLPGRVVRTEPAETRDLLAAAPMDGLPLHALGALRVDAVVLGTRDSSVATAVRRVDAGRVAQMGYAESWRWRMQGEGRAVHAHREFWSRLVGSVANAQYVAVPAATATDNAPVAQLVHALGPAEGSGPARPRGTPLPSWFGALVLVIALAEWASRRSRGAV